MNHELLSREPVPPWGEKRSADSVHKRRKTYLLGVCGMLAEILFSLSLILIGFAISLLCGW